MPLPHHVSEVKLKNGMRGLFVNVPGATLVYYDVYVRAGIDYAPRRVHQVAHVLEHLAFGANAKFNSLEAFSREFSKNGASSNASTSSIGMEYYAICADFEWQRILDLQQLALTEPVFKPSILEAEKGNVAEELEGYLANNHRVLAQKMSRSMGKRFWYDPDELKTVAPITLKDIQAHYRKTHTLHNLRFVFAGDLANMQSKIIQQLEGWQLPSGRELLIKPDTVHAGGLIYLPRKNLTSAEFSLELVIRRRLNLAERDAIGALNHILTGTLHSRIFGQARSRGICYDMGSYSYNDATGTSTWGFGGQVSWDHLGELFQLIFDELQKVAQGDISESELDGAKQWALGRHQMSGQTVTSVADWYASDYYTRHIIDSMDNVAREIKATTRAQILALVREFLVTDAWVLGGIGNRPKSEFQPYYDKVAAFLARQKQQILDKHQGAL